MQTLLNWISIPLGYVMEWCYALIPNYGVAIILFTLLTKIVLLPISVWVQKNSIKMVEMQPAINRIKAKFFGDADTIAEEQSKLYKAKKYNPLASLIPLVIQLILLMGVVEVIYHPFDYLFHMNEALRDAFTQLGSQISGMSLEESSIQLATIEALKNPATADQFTTLAALQSSNGAVELLESIRQFDLTFCGIDLSWIPSVTLGITFVVPVIAGLSSWLLCEAQNRSNVLQAEQSRLNKYGLMAFSVALSLYLGFFVPAGIALYWVASNLFAILQLYLLNLAIPPKKYVDYEELEASRRELDALKALGGKKKPFAHDENSKREKADYKRFFSIANKHVVFYSERSGFYKYFEALIDDLLRRTNLTIHYVTNDPNDAIFTLAETQPRIKPYYIGVKKLITLMMKMDADIVVMTTPDLDNYYIKRSLVRKDIEYIYVPHDCSSMHMGFREHALDNFDTVFCTGPHIAEETRASEAHYHTKEKALVEFGYPLIEELITSCEQMPGHPGERKQILIGPSWQEDNLLDSCITTLIDALYGDEYHIIVRPHPEYMKRYRPKMDALVERYRDKIGDGLTFELDFTSNASTYQSDLLITDWSGLSLEFCFATLRPALFINTKMKVENPHYADIGIVPQEIRLRSQLGVALEKTELDRVADTVRTLLADESHADTIRAIRERYFYHLGSHGAKGSEHIVQSLMARKSASK